MLLDPTPLSASFTRLLSSDERTRFVLPREWLVALNREIAEQFRQQPTFHGFVQRELLQAFPALAENGDPRRIFIRSSTTLPHPAVSSLVPHILEAVVRRIVERQPASYATGHTRFERGDGTGEVNAITAASFDGFLDQLANDLDNRYAAYLQAFWDASVSLTDTRSRRQWLAQQRAEQIRLEAEWLKADGVLSDGAYVLLTKVLRYPDALARRTNLRGYRPCVYALALAGEGAAPDLALHGALVLTARDPEHAAVWAEGQEPAPSVRPLKPEADVGTVVLFTPTRGLECFASLALLDQELHRRLKVDSEFAGLLMLAAQNDQTRAMGRHLEAKTQDQFLYGELNASAFSASVEAQCMGLRRDFMAQIELYRPHGVAGGMGDLPASLDRATDLQRAFGLESILLARELKRVAKALGDFLKPASADDRAAWARAVERYRHELNEVHEWQALPSLQQFGDTATLLAYSNEQLRMALSVDYGLDVDPDSLVISTQEPRRPVGGYVPGATPLVPEGPRYVTRQRTLTELALENVGGIDLNFVNFSRVTDGQGQPYSALSTSQIKDLVRSVNIGGRYPEFLKHRLLTSPEALTQKASYARIAAMQMRVDVLEAKIAGDFFPDRLDRGFQWVNSVLNHPQDSSERAQVEGHRILVRGLQIRGVRVRGVMVFSTASESVGSLVVYMPQAPSGRLFYEFRDSAQLAQQLIDHSAWHDYLVGRVALADQALIRRTLKRRVTGEMVHLPRISGDALMEAYELEANAAINAAAQRTTSTHETNIDTTFTLVEASLDIITLVLPVKVTMVIGLARSLFSLVRAIQAAQAHEPERAAHGFVRAFAELLGAVMDGVVGGARPSGGVIKSPGLSSKMALSEQPVGVTPLLGWERYGIFSQAPREGARAGYFLSHKGRWFSIKYDLDAEVWRLIDARKPFAYHYAPLRYDGAGNWEVASPSIGLKGGYPPEQTLMNTFPDVGPGGARRILDSFSFPQGRVLEYELELVREMSVWRDVPVRFHPYLNQPLDNVRMRTNGYEPLSSWPDEAGPSRVPVLPPVSLPVQPLRQWLWTDWGRVLPGSQVTPHASRPYTFTVNDPATGLVGDAILVDQRYYLVLPRGENCPDTLAHLYDPSGPPLRFTSFYDRLLFDFRHQPRIARYDLLAGTWRVNDHPLLFGDTNRLFAGVFPSMSVTTRLRLASAMFNQLNPDEVVTSGGLSAFLNHLSNWRSGLHLGPDPMQFMSVAHRDSAGRIRMLDTRGPAFFRMRFDFHAFRAVGIQVSDSMGTAALRLALRDLLTSVGYQLIAQGGPGPDLLFRWSAEGPVYCLRIHGRLGQSARVLPTLSSALDLSVLDSTTRALVTQSQVRGDFVMLEGGLVPRWPHPVIFVLKP